MREKKQKKRNVLETFRPPNKRFRVDERFIFNESNQRQDFLFISLDYLCAAVSCGCGFRLVGPVNRSQVQDVCLSPSTDGSDDCWTRIACELWGGQGGGLWSTKHISTAKAKKTTTKDSHNISNKTKIVSVKSKYYLRKSHSVEQFYSKLSTRSIKKKFVQKFEIGFVVR